MNREIKPVYQRSSCGVEWNEVTFDFYSRYAGVDGYCYRILYPAAAYEALKAEIDSLKTERQIMQDTNLAVVRRLQSKIDSLEREAKKDARYIVEAQQEAKDDDDSWYNCGEL